MKIDFNEIELAFMYVSSSQPFMNSAYLSKATGEIYYSSEMFDSDELPEDIDESVDYVAIPHKNDLNLGQKLVWRFVEKEIPGLSEKVSVFFRKKGAYSRYKSFLDDIGLLEKWHDFEDTKTREALRKWCMEKGIEIETN